MRKLFWVVVSLVAFLMQPCTSSDDVSVGQDSKLFNKEDLYIERAPSSISITDANKIARLFSGNNVNNTRALENPEVVTISDSITGTALLYIVNYSQNNGYVVESGVYAG